MINLIPDNVLAATAKFIIQSAINELKEQGHIISVKVPGYSETLEDSFSYSIDRDDERILVTISGNEYALEMNSGIKPGRMRYNPLEMLEWAKIVQPSIKSKRGLEKYMISLHRKHEEEGVPLAAAYKYTKNGRRTKFIEATIKNHQDDIEKMLDLTKWIPSAITDLVTKIKSQ